MKKTGVISVDGKIYPNVYSEKDKTAVVNADYEFHLVGGFQQAHRTGSFTVIFCDGRKEERKTYGSFQNAEKAMKNFVSPETVQPERIPALNDKYGR